MKIAITGTHFTPAQAVIEQLKKNPDNNIVYFGRKYTREGDKSPSIESQVLPQLGVKFIPIIAGRFQRSLTRYTIPSLLRVPLGILQSLYFVAIEKPDVVLSFGGYVSVPIVISAWLLSIPIIIHEQTLDSGFANTISSWFANKIAISFMGNNSFNQNRTILTGNPMRADLFASVRNSKFTEIVKAAKEKKLPLILITGGNQGSHIINETIYNCLEDLTKIAFIIHQTGDSKFNDYENLNKKKKTLKFPERYMVTEWIDSSEMGYIFENTDLAVSRAGINTLLELAYFGIPTLVIPISYLYKNEQMVNAEFFEKAGLTAIILQSKLTATTLLSKISEMVNNLFKLKEKARNAKKLCIPDAASRVALETILLAKKPR